MLQMIITRLFCGFLLGFILQRGKFCLTGGLRDMYISKDYKMFYALLIAIAVQSVGIYSLLHFGFIQFSSGRFVCQLNQFFSSSSKPIQFPGNKNIPIS